MTNKTIIIPNLDTPSCFGQPRTAILILAEIWVMSGVGEGRSGERDRRCQGHSAELQVRIHGVSGLPGLPSPVMRHDQPALLWGGETQ